MIQCHHDKLSTYLTNFNLTTLRSYRYAPWSLCDNTNCLPYQSSLRVTPFPKCTDVWKNFELELVFTKKNWNLYFLRRRPDIFFACLWLNQYIFLLLGITMDMAVIIVLILGSTVFTQASPTFDVLSRLKETVSLLFFSICWCWVMYSWDINY